MGFRHFLIPLALFEKYKYVFLGILFVYANLVSISSNSKKDTMKSKK